MKNLLFNPSFRIDDPASALPVAGVVVPTNYSQAAIVNGWKFYHYPGTLYQGGVPQGTTPPGFSITRVAVTAAENAALPLNGSKFIRIARTSVGTGRPATSFYALWQRIDMTAKHSISDKINHVFSFYAKTDVVGRVGVNVTRNFGSGGSSQVICAQAVVNLVPGTQRYFVPVWMPAPGTYTTGTSPYLDIFLTVQEGGIASGYSFAMNPTYISFIQPQLEEATTPFPSAFVQDNPPVAVNGLEVSNGDVFQTGSVVNTALSTAAAAGTVTVQMDGPLKTQIVTLEGSVTLATSYSEAIPSTRVNKQTVIFRHSATVGVGAKALNFPGAWSWVSPIPGTLASTKIGVLTLVDVPAAAGETSTIVASWDSYEAATAYLPLGGGVLTGNLTVDKIILDSTDPTRFLEHDGTNYTLAGTSPLSVDEIKFSGDVWDDSMVPGMSLRTQGTADPTLDVVTGGIRAYGFSASVQQEVFGSLQLPHSYKEGSDIIPHVHWSPSTTGAGDVIWGLEYVWTSIGAAPSAATTIYATATASGVLNQHQIAAFAAITGTSKGISSVLMFRLFRKAADGADTYGGVAYLMGFDAHHKKDTVGSSTSTAK